MKYIRAVNKKASRIEEEAAAATSDVFALQQPQPERKPHIPVGCATTFFPGWEVDSSGGTAGLCQPAERDLYDCYSTCFWPAQVPDHLNNASDWTKKCAAATKDWRNIDLIFP